MSFHIGAGGVVKTGTALPIGVSGVVRTPHSGYIGINGVARPFFNFKITDVKYVRYVVTTIVVYNYAATGETNTYVGTVYPTANASTTQANFASLISKAINIYSKQVSMGIFTGNSSSYEWQIHGDPSSPLSFGQGNVLLQAYGNQTPFINVYGYIQIELTNGQKMDLFTAISYKLITKASITLWVASGGSGSWTSRYNAYFLGSSFFPNGLANGGDVKSLTKTETDIINYGSTEWLIGSGSEYGNVFTNMYFNNRYSGYSGSCVLTDAFGTSKTFDKSNILYGFAQ